MSADNLYDDLRSKLRLTARVVKKTGNDINVREKFVMRFSVLNTAYAANRVDLPDIIFDKPQIYVEGTEYAEPVEGNGWRSVPDQKLRPGEGSSVDVEMVAKRNIGGIADWFQTERVARTWARAQLDEAAFFQIWTYRDVHEELQGT